MKPFLFVAFVRWIFSKISELNEFFRDTLRHEPVLAMFAWLFVSIISIVSITISGLVFIDNVEQAGRFVLAQIAVAVSYLLVNGVITIYEAFKRDRPELFNISKDTK